MIRSFLIALLIFISAPQVIAADYTLDKLTPKLSYAEDHSVIIEWTKYASLGFVSYQVRSVDAEGKQEIKAEISDFNQTLYRDYIIQEGTERYLICSTSTQDNYCSPLVEILVPERVVVEEPMPEPEPEPEPELELMPEPIIKEVVEEEIIEEEVVEVPSEPIAIPETELTLYETILMDLEDQGIMSAEDSNRIMNRAEIVTAIINAELRFQFSFAFEAVPNCFTDIPSGKDQPWYHDRACFAKKRGFYTGLADGTFRAHEGMNISQLASTLVKAFELEKEDHSDLLTLKTYFAIPPTVQSQDRQLTRGEFAFILNALIEATHEDPFAIFERS